MHLLEPGKAIQLEKKKYVIGEIIEFQSQLKVFDIGAAEFSPSEKYYDKGWENCQKAWLYGDNIAKKEELNEWWK